MIGYEDFEITMTRGDERAVRFTVIDTNNSSQPVDLTGYTNLQFLAKKRFSDLDAAAVVNLTMGSGLTVTNASGGVIDLETPRAQTNALANRRHQLPAILRGDNASGKRKTIQRGLLVVYPN